MSQNFSRNIDSFNTIINVSSNLTADNRSEILAWLSLLELKLWHQDVQCRRVGDVGEWLLHTEKFRSWYDSSGEGEGDNAVLFCYGDPGVGKTFISSLVVDSLCDQTSGQNTPITCFYFDFASRKEQSAANMLGSLLKQIVSEVENIPEAISRAFQEQKKAIGGRLRRLSEIVKMLHTITSLQQTFICIDALDECTPVHRVKLLASLKEILEKSPGTRLFVIGRPYVRAEIEKRLVGQVISVAVGPSKDAIIMYPSC